MNKIEPNIIAIKMIFFYCLFDLQLIIPFSQQNYMKRNDLTNPSYKTPLISIIGIDE